MRWALIWTGNGSGSSPGQNLAAGVSDTHLRYRHSPPGVKGLGFGGKLVFQGRAGEEVNVILDGYPGDSRSVAGAGTGIISQAHDHSAIGCPQEVSVFRADSDTYLGIAFGKV